MVKRNRLGLRSLVALSTMIVVAMTFAPNVGASVQPAVPAPGARSTPPTSTVVFRDLGPGHGVNGFSSGLSDAARLGGYPTAIDPAWSVQNEGFAGLIRMQITDGPGKDTFFFTYCIDLFTVTIPGNAYKRGEWTEANVPNVGYVAQLLQSYYPTTDQPSSITDDSERAAAVQASIWYFSDGFVVADPGSQLFKDVSAIVNQVIHDGPLAAPPAPTLTVTGPPSGATNSLVGPFVVDTDGKVATGRVPEGVTAFSDAAGTDPLLLDPFPVSDGDSIWLRSTEAGVRNPALTITATATQPGGVVYLYVPPESNPGGIAQTLILAGPLEAETDVNTSVEFFLGGDLPITKTITGAAAGQQGPIQIDIVCSSPNSSIPPFTIPAGATGVHTTIVTGITVPAHCKLTETRSGKTQEVDVFEDTGELARSLAAPVPAEGFSEEVAVCPETNPQSLAASPKPTFVNDVEPTTSSTIEGSTTTATEGGSTPTTVAGSTTTVAGSTTTAVTVAPTTVVPTTSPNECELSGSTTAAPTTAPQVLPETGADSGPLGLVGLLGLVAGIGVVVLTQRRRFTD